MSGTAREEVTYPCPSCGKGVILITAATDALVRGLYCRVCKTRQTVRLRAAHPSAAAPVLARTPPAAGELPRVPATAQIETRRIRERRG